ncbi:CobW family GTP-binding protein [Nocardioides allogilvus]|uniref:CobW family GTP-binding protein n=1 Tax=Nocardioides allogilvus TaxID=2072017 RepID=UPI000D319051|nr:GTP-binding protein [Nocardioides allogilvus]
MTLLLATPRPAYGSVTDRRRVTILSGFLGSGKSTLLRSHARRLSPLIPRVVVNDYASIEVDDILTGDLRRHQRMVTGGCACCTRRDELAQALRLSLDDDPSGAEEDRDVIVETSGLSDPGPIAFTVAHDPVLKHHYTLAEICVTVDALTGAASLDRHAVAMRQVLAADRIFVTKADLVDERSVRSLVDRIHAMNPTAGLTVTAQGEPRWSVPPRSAAHPGSTERDLQGGVEPHTGSVSTIELRTTTPLDWQAFSVWLSLLLHEYGPRVLRVKGRLDIQAVGPVALNGVQHIIHRPEHLTHPVPPGTRLILITEGLDTATVERSFGVFMGLAGKEPTS